MNVRYLHREEIEDKRWNGCVHFAINALPYAYTWYLDNVCEQWSGLVLGDYRAVMPLVWNKKYGIQYIYQPFFVQQLGVFASKPIGKQLMQVFWQAIPSQFKYADMCLNEENQSIEDDLVHVDTRSNFVLHLKQSYEAIRTAYSGLLLKNLRKAEKAGLTFRTDIKPEQFVDYYVTHTSPKVPGFQEKHKHMMHRIIYQSIYWNMGKVVGVFNNEKALCAANFLLIHPARIISVMPASNDLGRKNGAMPFLIDTLLRIHSDQQKYFDFEGSMIPSVANFYKGFGAEEKYYKRIVMNKLPWYIRWMKG